MNTPWTRSPLAALLFLGCTGPAPPPPTTGLDCGADAPATLHADGDGDGFGNPEVSRELCPGTPGWVSDATDCDDTSADVSPAAVEECSGRDDDCDGLVDGDDPDVVDPSVGEGWPDADGDGWGALGDPTGSRCGTVAVVGVSGDCDDADAAVSPSAIEACGNGVDDDCDGAGCALPVDGDITDAHLLFASPDTADGTGRSVVAVDLDGDGAAELVSGAPWSNVGGFGAGGLSVVSPAAEPWGDVSVEDRGVVLGRVAESMLGAALATGSDFDGDGVPELLGTGTGTGDDAAWLLSGAALIASEPVSATDATLTRFRKWAGGSYSAAMPGDLDGDGLADLLLGSHDAVLSAGKVWVVYGEEDGWDPIVYLDDVDTWVRGDYPGDRFASSPDTHAHGDYDGDGVLDLVFGVPLVHGPGPDRGAVAVWYGDGGRLDGGQLAVDAEVRLIGPDPESAFGTAAVRLGDVDGDGLPELAVGAPGAEDGAGAVFLFSGDTARWADGGTDGATGRMVSMEAGLGIGGALDAPGDLTLDGRPDLLVGVEADERGDSTLGMRGSVRVYDGAEFAGTFLSTNALWRVMGDEVDARVGGPGSFTSGDLNGDGWPDVAVGAPGLGEVALFYGGGL